jgi:glycosyltransferase involved in cell wall biosynthesis
VINQSSVHARRPVVLHVYKDYWPPVMGGIERTMNLMARETRDEFDVRVLVNSGQWRGREENIDGVEVTRIGEWGRVASTPISPGFLWAFSRAVGRGVDLIHLHHPNPLGDLAYALSRTRLPVVMTYHSDVVRQKRLMRLYSPLQNFVMGRCKVIMPTSPDYAESSSWLRMHRERCRVVPLGIDTEALQGGADLGDRVARVRAGWPGGPGPVILFTGRLRYYKGLHFLVEAMLHVQKDARLVIGGDGPDRARLAGMVERLGLQNRIHFMGTMSDEDLPAVLRAADIYCMPSHLRSEAFGLSQVEAMACGLPVVGTDLDTGVRFVNKDMESGLVVPAGNPMALADGLNRLLGDDGLRNALGDGARKRVQRLFTAGRMGESLKQVYRSVLSAEPE